MEQLNSFLVRVTTDEKLRTCHMSLYTALFQVWIGNGCKSPFRISRRKIMRAAKISSLATYHKVIRELISYGYILYNPSYHPLKGSEIILIQNPHETAKVC